MNQSTSSVFMVRPHSFRKNEETATNNHYQRDIAQASPEEIIERAQEEFDGLVGQLKAAGVEVVVFDEAEPHETPDALFPNNWVSTHADGTVALYPMFAPNRRTERREDIPLVLEHQFGFDVRQIIDFTEFESHNKFLEGTGSIVLDRVNRKAYAALSDRTDARALEHFCDQLDFEPVAFKAFQTVDNQRLPIYHTNVMMSIGSGYAVVCLNCIDSDEERKQVVDAIAQDGLELIAITEEQVNQFAGNMLELTGDDGPVLVMSASAYQSLVPEQIEKLQQHTTLLHAPLPTIETCGGGSARCMIAEIHLPEQNA
ncbi:MAG TPA: amidinotransferase [Flavobacteriales bacterium]|nr:amidinotransferase [Flavobacteriales bacterium]|tara:strand:- start:140 stop:1081 length:942 start_codon:yes stop_codon:yes gene_type:complete